MRLLLSRALAAGLTIAVCAVVTSTYAAGQNSCPAGSSGQSCTAPGSSTSDPKELVGTKAPAVSGKSLNGTGTVDLSSLVTKPTAVVFWLNSCPHCRKEMPAVNRLGQHVGPHGQIVAVAIDAGLKGPDGFATPQAATRTLHLTLPTILAPKAEAMAWGQFVTPTAFILDSSGVITKVIEFGSGSLTGQIKRALSATT